MLNKVTLIGRLGRDPEIRSTQSGTRIANLNIATDEQWRDKQTGERKTKTEWHRVSVMSDALSGVCEKYLAKGSKVYIEGKLQTRKWTDQQGIEKFTTEIVLSGFDGKLLMLSGKAEAKQEQQADDGLNDSIPF